MITWLPFWTYLLIGVITVFAGLAIAVAIGGFFDVKALFRTIDEQHAHDQHAHDQHTDAKQHAEKKR